jgi:hypothetical protein
VTAWLRISNSNDDRVEGVEREETRSDDEDEDEDEDEEESNVEEIKDDDLPDLTGDRRYI